MYTLRPWSLVGMYLLQDITIQFLIYYLNLYGTVHQTIKVAKENGSQNKQILYYVWIFSPSLLVVFDLESCNIWQIA